MRKKKFENLWESLKDLFRKDNEIDPKEVKKIMYLFFMDEEWTYIQSITDVRVFEIDSQSLRIDITSFRPGILIGKGGSFIDKLKKDLSETLNKKIELSLTENKFWYNLWKD